MSNNSVFNAAVCLIGIIIFSVHIASLLFKKHRRRDENYLLVFFVFTLVHFATYLTFTLVKIKYTSDAYIMAFYSTFYVMNNMEIFLLFLYMLSYIIILEKTKKILSIVNLSLFLVFVLLDIVNIFARFFFTAEGGEYVRAKTMIISQGYQLVLFVIIFFVAVLNKKLNLREKIAFALYCFIPLATVILQNIFKGYAIAYAGIILAVEVLFFFINVEKNIEISKNEEKNKEAQIKIMVSQIQPHFIYNSLSSISTLIAIDPEKAQKALDDFTEYLRGNLSSLTETRLIPFENELKHIKTFIELEKMRFNERISVVYDIQVSDFNIPCLSIQPIVENAVKHGILQRIEGGTISISTYEDKLYYFVEIMDDGIGFDIKDIDFEGNTHIGLKNIKYRIENMGNGQMSIFSEVDKGTRVIVKFYK